MTAITPAYTALTGEQREELRAVYAAVHHLHHIPFERCLIDQSIRICLWNTAQARKRKAARQKAALEQFQLAP